MSEFKRCEYPCWINHYLTYPRAIMWPRWFDPEREDGIWYLWDFYIQWDNTVTVGKRGRVNRVRICSEHHKAILQMIGDERDQEIREQEATEQWLIENNNQMR